MEEKPKIALAVIAGEHAIEDGIERMLRSVVDQVDGVYIAYTASNDGVYDGNVEVFNQISDLMSDVGIKYGTLAPIGWENDFSLARNASFEMVYQHPGVTYDWIIWLDCDDVIPFDVDLGLAVEYLEMKKAQGGFMQYEYQYDQERDEALVVHLKERLFRADIPWRWVFPIHENCQGPFATRMAKLPDAQRVRHLRGDVKPKRDRNRAIVGKWFRDEPQNPRAMMYFAHETVAMAEESREREHGAAADVLYKQALKIYQQFLSTQPASDDAYTCNRACADILRTLGQFENSINVDLQGIKMEPSKVGSYVGIAETYLNAGDYDGAAEWAKRVLSEDQPLVRGFSPIIELEKQYKPLMILSMALKAQRLYVGARHYGEKALLIRDDAWTRLNLEEIKQYHDTDVPPVDESVQGDVNRQVRWGDQPDNSIAFWVPPSAEPWNPDLLRHGLGGTETTILKVAVELAHRGMRVVIFGTPGDWNGKTQDIGEGSIEWYSANEFHPDEPFTYFVGLRAPQVMDAQVKAQVKILWVHDVAMGPTRYSEYGDRFSCDAILYPSISHMMHFKRIYKYNEDPWTAQDWVLENGFDVAPFTDYGKVKRDPHRVVYASSPDRGLTRLLELWPDIAARVPNANLNIYYGWDSIDAIIENGGPTAPQLEHFKQTTIETMSDLIEDGHRIAWHGRVGEKLLGKEFLSSGVIAYPANFQETFGIVFAQAMRAGVIPVVPNLGHLPWMVQNLGIVVPGPPDAWEYGPRFVDAMVLALTDAKPEVRMELSQSVEYLDYSNHIDSWVSTLKKIKTTKESK